MARLLLIDDSDSMALISRVLARRTGHEFSHAPDTTSAAPLLPGTDLVLLDVNLPGTSGPAWLATLKARPPVALFVQGGLWEDVEHGWNAGADYLLPKELVTDLSAWETRLKEVLAHANGHLSFTSLSLPPSISEGAVFAAVARLLPALPSALLHRARVGPPEGMAERVVDQVFRLLGRAEARTLVTALHAIG
jgi:DNA-binding response OmpR family regulator